MKVKCPSCGKKEMELMSKYEIKTSNFVAEAVAASVIKKAMEWLEPSKYVCHNCGHIQDA